MPPPPHTHTDVLAFSLSLPSLFFLWYSLGLVSTTISCERLKIVGKTDRNIQYSSYWWLDEILEVSVSTLWRQSLFSSLFQHVITCCLIVLAHFKFLIRSSFLCVCCSQSRQQIMTTVNSQHRHCLLSKSLQDCLISTTEWYINKHQYCSF